MRPPRRGRDRRIPQLLTVYLKTRGSCESSQLGLLCMYMGDRKTLLTAVHHFDCPARLLRPQPPQYPHLTPRPDGFFFFFLTVCRSLAPLLHHTKPLRRLAGVRSHGGPRDTEVAEQIKRIRRSLFTDASKLLLALSFKTSLPSSTHQLRSPTDGVFLSTKPCMRGPHHLEMKSDRKKSASHTPDTCVYKQYRCF